MRQIKYLRRAATALLGATMLFTSLPILALEDIGEWDLPGEKIIYVSPNGSDDGDGSEAKPYRTLGAADKAVGDIISGGAHVSDITVYLGGGVYPVSYTHLQCFAAPDRFAEVGVCEDGVHGYGRMLSEGHGVSVFLRDSAGTVHELAVTEASCYEIRAAVPALARCV